MSNPKPAQVEVHVPFAASCQGTTLRIDGKEIGHVTAILFDAAVGDVPRLSVTFMPASFVLYGQVMLEAEQATEAQIEERSQPVHIDGPRCWCRPHYVQCPDCMGLGCIECAETGTILQHSRGGSA